jgi:hypothetical protein
LKATRIVLLLHSHQAASSLFARPTACPPSCPLESSCSVNLFRLLRLTVAKRRALKPQVAEIDCDHQHFHDRPTIGSASVGAPLGWQTYGRSPRKSITSELPFTRADQERLSNIARGFSNQPSGFYLAIWRMRLPFLSSILSLEFRKGCC